MGIREVFRAATALVLVASSAGCAFPPRDAEVQWVARDAWDRGCASQAIFEKLKISDRGWKDRGAGIYTVSVEATVKMVNPCHSDVTGKSYAQFESVEFSFDHLAMKKCKQGGDDGWMLDQPTARCITGPAPAGKSVLPDKLPPPRPVGGTLRIPPKGDDGADGAPKATR